MNVGIVEVCERCGHVHLYEDRCGTCGCGSDDRVMVRDQRMVRITGNDLEMLRKALASNNTHLLRISWYGDHITFKVNEGVWSHGIGSIQPPY